MSVMVGDSAVSQATKKPIATMGYANPCTYNVNVRRITSKFEHTGDAAFVQTGGHAFANISPGNTIHVESRDPAKPAQKRLLRNTVGKETIVVRFQFSYTTDGTS